MPSYFTVISSDLKSFHFNIESNGRLSEPMKYEIRDTNNGGYVLFDHQMDVMINLGGIVLYRQETMQRSEWKEEHTWFDYHGIENGVRATYGFFTPKKFIVIQMI